MYRRVQLEVGEAPDSEFIVALCVQQVVGEVSACIRFNPGRITPIEQLLIFLMKMPEIFTFSNHQ